MAQRTIDRYLRDADAKLPGRVVAFHLVGSIALRAYRPGRSDVDFVAVLDGTIDAAVLRRLRALHRIGGLRTAATNVRRGRPVASGTLNGVFVRAADVAVPVSRLPAIAHQVGPTFALGAGRTSVSPVEWKVLVEHGVTLRGGPAASAGFEPEPDALRPWNLANLEAYWRPWAAATRAHAGHRRARRRPEARTSWGVLGVARLHHTIANGEIASKEHAGRYALETFDAAWQDLVADALAWRTARHPVDTLGCSGRERAERTASFVDHVIDDARRVAADLGLPLPPVGRPGPG